LEPWSGIAAFAAGAVLADGALSWMHGRGWIYYEGLSRLAWTLLRGGDRGGRR